MRGASPRKAYGHAARPSGCCDSPPRVRRVQWAASAAPSGGATAAWMPAGPDGALAAFVQQNKKYGVILNWACFTGGLVLFNKWMLNG